MQYVAASAPTTTTPTPIHLQARMSGHPISEWRRQIGIRICELHRTKQSRWGAVYLVSCPSCHAVVHPYRMPPASEDRLIQLLNEQIAGAKAGNPDDFKEWKARTGVVLRSAVGDDSDLVEKFEAIRY